MVLARSAGPQAGRRRSSTGWCQSGTSSPRARTPVPTGWNYRSGSVTHGWWAGTGAVAGPRRRSRAEWGVMMNFRAAGAGLTALGAIACVGACAPPAGGFVEGAVAVTPGAAVPATVGSGGDAQALVYDWPPSPEPSVVRDFEPPAKSWAACHRGVDLEATAGQPVRAAAAGVVAFAGRVVDRPVVSIDHDDGIRTTYEPVDPVVRVGTTVAAGTDRKSTRLNSSHVATS